MMTKRWSLLFCLLLSLALWLPGISSAQSLTVEMSQEDLLTLQQNCQTQETALTQSLQDLEEARTLLQELEQDLSESETALSESQAALTTLKAELVQQKTELVKLKLELSRLKTESAKLSSSLSQAEKSLNDTQKAYQKEKTKLIREKRVWQIIAVAAACVAIGR